MREDNIRRVMRDGRPVARSARSGPESLRGKSPRTTSKATGGTLRREDAMGGRLPVRLGGGHGRDARATSGGGGSLVVLAALGWLHSAPELRPSGVGTTRRHLGAALAPRFCETKPFVMLGKRRISHCGRNGWHDDRKMTNGFVLLRKGRCEDGRCGTHAPQFVWKVVDDGGHRPPLQ
jgi:hypothetical protein